MMLSKLLPLLTEIQLTRIKLALLVSFSALMLLQFLIGFSSFEDYLVVFVFVLFLNDLYTKLRRPNQLLMKIQAEPVSRRAMSFVFLILLTLPFILDAFNVTNETRAFLYKIGFLLWGEVFLLDAFIHYKETHSRQWLVITNMAVILIIMGALIA